MSVVSQTNKNMLFELMKSIGSENNLVINESALDNFITEKCGFFHANRFEFGNLNEVNKKIVEISYNYIMSNQPRQESKTKVVTPVLSKREAFDTGLASQESQFNEMINPKKPKDIDFTDGSKEFPIDNMVGVMNQTMADRQKELENITQKYSSNDKEKAQKWLNQSETTTKIKIEKSSNLVLDIPVHQEKRVRFEEPKKALVNNLFSKLKQKGGDDIMNKLDIIISNQEKILNALN
jgi:hypothetical protein